MKYVNAEIQEFYLRAAMLTDFDSFKGKKVHSVL